MAITDHIAILAHSALVAKVKNKNNDRMEFYAVLAFPPSAANDLMSVFTDRTNGAPLGNFKISVSTNAQSKKPIAGVPGDWFVVRSATQYAPFLSDVQGVQLDQDDVAQHGTIRQTFYAGKRVRASISAWSWVNKTGEHGLSLNLHGIMDAGVEGERLAIGNSAANAFAQHAKPNAQGAADVLSNTPAAAPATANPFGGPQTAAASSANPFQQAAPAASTNPFATAA